MRLDRYLANSGVGTRSEVKKIIHSKRVMVNGVIAKSDSLQVDENKDVILLDDEQIRYSKFYYIVLNKPEGYVSAVEDNLYPPVTDLISEYAFAKLFPVGRLDVDTTGTLLLTNDGELCHNMLSPKKHVDKTYSVEVDGEIKPELIDKFKAGIMLDDELTLPADLLILDKHHAELTIHQGKFHQVKRMFKYFNLNVIKLDRKSFG
ncbi:MAG: rRNA pseudouridine synthase, partial [Bacilli bacterium]|nr:rRNA pseudouridine synthase [Bacilli bacterium]